MSNKLFRPLFDEILAEIDGFGFQVEFGDGSHELRSACSSRKVAFENIGKIERAASRLLGLRSLSSMGFRGRLPVVPAPWQHFQGVARESLGHGLEQPGQRERQERLGGLRGAREAPAVLHGEAGAGEGEPAEDVGRRGAQGARLEDVGGAEREEYEGVDWTEARRGRSRP